MKKTVLTIVLLHLFFFVSAQGTSEKFKIKLPKVDTLVDGGRIVSKGESTIIDFNNGELKIIREGSVSKEEIEKIL